METVFKRIISACRAFRQTGYVLVEKGLEKGNLLIADYKYVKIVAKICEVVRAFIRGRN